MTLAFGQVFCRGTSGDALTGALDRILFREGFAPFSLTGIPANYPELPREFARLAIGQGDDAGTVALLMDDWTRTFARTLNLSRELPGATLVALVHPPLELTRAKAYRDAELILKVGDDPDEELFYNPALSEGPALAAFASSWKDGLWLGREVGYATMDGLLSTMVVARVDAGFHEAVAGAWPTPTELRLYISRRSRLFLEA